MKLPMIENIKDLVSQAVMYVCTRPFREMRVTQKPVDSQLWTVERPQKSEHGDFSTNAAMVLAKTLNTKPRELAAQIIKAVHDPDSIIDKMDIAGPGFINFKIKNEAWQKTLTLLMPLEDIIPNIGQGRKVLVELVSANPTGPLHIGNARGGPLGDAIAALLQKTGHKVVKTFYSNDIGGQVDRLGTSLLHWVKTIKKMETQLPHEGYFGEYVQELACEAIRDLKISATLGDETLLAQKLSHYGVKKLNEEIRSDCEAMGISFDEWVYESDIRKNKGLENIIDCLRKNHVTREAEGALWFAPQDDFMQDRESVLIRSSGEPTYFADDIVCHDDRYKSGYETIIDVWGSNHHGHVPKIKAALKVLGHNPDKLEAILYQYVRVVRGQEIVKMSKRAGNFVIAREVLDEVGRDAFRFFLLMRAASAHLDFDIALARQQSQENPVYYVQYAHARICSILSKAPHQPPCAPDCSLLDLEEEINLIKILNDYPTTLYEATLQREPHRLVFYLLDLARHFQSYYSRAKKDGRFKVLSEDVDRTHAKLYLVKIIKEVLSDALNLLGVSAPHEMRLDDKGED